MTSLTRKEISIIGLLLLATFSIRVALVRLLPNDAPQDGPLYGQMARNLVERHIYSQDSAPPYAPSLRRMPGYPLFIAGVYSVFGYDKTAVRIIQALLDTATCAMIGMLAYLWDPEKRRRISAAAAIALAAVCPFTAIYAATILTETPAMFFAVTMTLAASIALQATDQGKVLLWWAVSGVLAGFALLFRPDSGLFLLAIGLTLGVATLSSAGKSIWNRATRTIYSGVVFSLAVVLMLMPWAIRNYRVFSLVQPLSPTHGEMPGEFLPNGYLAWVHTWIDDARYVGPVIFTLNASPITITSIPDKAFDSSEEKLRVAALLADYSHAVDVRETGGRENNHAKAVAVMMTSEIDAGFAKLAGERVSRNPFRFYVWLPLKRAGSLWFDTHSQYYPFQGELFPPNDLNQTTSDKFFLFCFAFLTLVYTLLGVMGAWFLWRSSQSKVRLFVLLAVLMILLRVSFFAAIERPEPRYVVELFPFLCVLGGVAVNRFTSRWTWRARQRVT
jgi:4-amino-4-deoxy-L-arabinose transferase-like glycosyltransferase